MSQPQIEIPKVPSVLVKMTINNKRNIGMFVHFPTWFRADQGIDPSELCLNFQMGKVNDPTSCMLDRLVFDWGMIANHENSVYTGKYNLITMKVLQVSGISTNFSRHATTLRMKQEIIMSQTYMQMLTFPKCQVADYTVSMARVTDYDKSFVGTEKWYSNRLEECLHAMFDMTLHRFSHSTLPTNVTTNILSLLLFPALPSTLQRSNSQYNILADCIKHQETEDELVIVGYHMLMDIYFQDWTTSHMLKLQAYIKELGLPYIARNNKSMIYPILVPPFILAKKMDIAVPETTSLNDIEYVKEIPFYTHPNINPKISSCIDTSVFTHTRPRNPNLTMKAYPPMYLIGMAHELVWPETYEGGSITFIKNPTGNDVTYKKVPNTTRNEEQWLVNKYADHFDPLQCPTTRTKLPPNHETQSFKDGTVSFFMVKESGQKLEVAVQTMVPKLDRIGLSYDFAFIGKHLILRVGEVKYGWFS